MRPWKSSDVVATFSEGPNFYPPVARSSGSDQSQREEDFYYTRICCEAVDFSSAPAPVLAPAPVPAPAPSHPSLGQASSSPLSWASCGSPPPSGLQIPPAHRPRSNSSSEAVPNRAVPLSQSAPSSFWQIHSEHLYQVGAAGVSEQFGPSDSDCCQVLAEKVGNYKVLLGQ